MPPCGVCGAAFAAHVDGACPAAGFQGAGQPFTSWAPPPGGPPYEPQMAGPRPSWDDWLRRYPVLVGAIVLVVLLAGVGIGVGAVHAASHRAAAQPNGNSTACSYYWGIASSASTNNIEAEAAGWPALQAAASGITNPALASAVQTYDQDLYWADFTDAEADAGAIGSACTALGYGNPGQ